MMFFRVSLFSFRIPVPSVKFVAFVGWKGCSLVFAAFRL